MSSPGTLTSTELVRYIESASESSSLDAKGPMAWDGGPASARLAKDIAAFANSKDGGVIVLGKSEIGAGKFDLQGLSQKQADSFETTKVANWVNQHFTPPITLVCYRVDHQGKTVVVLTVAEFDDVPIVCNRSFQEPGAKKPLLQEKTIYIRNANAESAPLGTIEEVRELIGRATLKRADQLLAAVSVLLKGGAFRPTPTDKERFDAEVEQVTKALDADSRAELDAGSWQLAFHPGSYDPKRWMEREQLDRLIMQYSVRNEFPFNRETHPREWGLANNAWRDEWALTRSGMFLLRSPFHENLRASRSPWHSGLDEPDAGIPAKEWIEFQWNVRLLIKMFCFMSRFAEAYQPAETICYRITAGPLAGRKLISEDPNVSVGYGLPPPPCRTPRFIVEEVLPVAEFRADWENKCGQTMKQFFELFPHTGISLDTLLGWIQRFKDRKF